MVAPRTVSFALILTGAFELVRRKALAVLVAAVTFAMIAASASAFVERKVDGIQADLAEMLSMNREDLSREVETQLLQLSALNMEEFVTAVQNRSEEMMLSEDGMEPDASKLGIAYVVRAGPYLVFEFFVDILAMYLAMIFFFLLFTRGTLPPFDAVALLPMAALRSIGFFLWCLLRPFYFITFFGPILGLTVLLSGEAGIRESVRIGSKRLFSKPFTIFLSGIGILITAFLCLWPMLVVAAAVVLFSTKIGFFLILGAFFLVVAFLAAAFTMLAAIVA